MQAIKCLETVTRSMGKIARKVAAYQWYTCYPQIISRICHRQPEVYALLEEIPLQVLVTCPQQAMWSMIGICTASRCHVCDFHAWSSRSLTKPCENAVSPVPLAYGHP